MQKRYSDKDNKSMAEDVSNVCFVGKNIDILNKRSNPFW